MMIQPLYEAAYDFRVETRKLLHRVGESLTPSERGFTHKISPKLAMDCGAPKKDHIYCVLFSL